MTILFVCTGNTCRSAMAEAMMKDIASKDDELRDIEVISAGVGVYLSGPASHGAKSALNSFNINADNHQSKPLTLDLISRADIILTMTQSHKIRVFGMNPELENTEKVFTLKEFVGQEEADIQDPFGLSEKEYKECALEIHNALMILKDKLKAMKR